MKLLDRLKMEKEDFKKWYEKVEETLNNLNDLHSVILSFLNEETKNEYKHWLFKNMLMSYAEFISFINDEYAKEGFNSNIIKKINNELLMLTKTKNFYIKLTLDNVELLDVYKTYLMFKNGKSKK
ncbi:hypothetical protein [Mycoplasma sp. CSL7503-lung]|uniref:hypothetical protein n=1 Tax=Mycoplasma sp. CSL7503-lung TaxID=536372 RepID=UPI0021D338A8|nr:hypothetical protein [Mycoplasma sp. CSL7503-lung]MCU4706439.1 hypothetical protein [Mycoplasma sp. CSL7503-lung]